MTKCPPAVTPTLYLVSPSQVCFLLFGKADQTGTMRRFTLALKKAEVAAGAGFEGIVFDGFRKLLTREVKLTKQAVEMLESVRPDLLVEGELGLGSSSEMVENLLAEWLKLTLPREAVQFVSETKVDVLGDRCATERDDKHLLARGARGSNEPAETTVDN